MMEVVWPDGQPATYVPPKPGKAKSGLRATSEYGWRTHPVSGVYTKHWGLDLIGVKDGIVKAPFAGTVTIASYSGGYGNLVEITAPNGDRVRLGHNKSFKVKKGAKVKVGQAVAVWNSTGNSTGTHCHLEFIPKGKQAVNPRDYMAAHRPKPSKPKPKPKPAGGSKSNPKDVLKWRWLGLQRMLKSDFGYKGPVDNKPGFNTISAFQRFMNAKGYAKRAPGLKRKLIVDGAWGEPEVRAAQQWLKERWGYTGPVDGIHGPNTKAAWGRAEAANNKAYARVK